MITTETTGRIRYREQKRLFKESVLVLQVEIREKGYSIGPYGIGNEIDYCFWRDATTEDLTLPAK